MKCYKNAIAKIAIHTILHTMMCR